jgi:indole-3-glycerol phosphate synthase
MSILTEILRNKMSEVARAKERKPLAQVEREARATPPARDFIESLEKGASPLALIAEVKRASPSKGALVDTYDPSVIAMEYERAGASCISVLTDERFFHGSNAHLVEVRESVSLPVLRKDFIVEAYQVFESRAMGADCVLLIVAALSSQQLRDYLAVAADLAMAALVEVHDEGEMEAALTAGSKLVGINNRSLRTFETDIATTERLAKLAPSRTVLVSESAIFTRDDARRVAEVGVKAILVGEALMTAPSIAQKVEELIGK